MASETAAIQEKQRLKRLEEQIQDMLLSTIDYRQIVRELDHECKYSSREKLEVVRLQKVLSHYVVQRDNMLVLKS
jgi:hypothetical protein